MIYRSNIQLSMYVIVIGLMIFIAGYICINIFDKPSHTSYTTTTVHEVSEAELMLMKQEIDRLDKISRTGYNNKGE